MAVEKRIIPGIGEHLHRLATRPNWLIDVLRPEVALPALTRHIPEAATGALRLVRCERQRLCLNNASGRWSGEWDVTVEWLPDGQRQVISLNITLTAPGHPLPRGAARPSPHVFGSVGWSCYIPELRLWCELAPTDQGANVLPQLLDPEQARALIERGISIGSPGKRDIRIQACQPQSLNDNSGSHCVIRYQLTYAEADMDRGWPATVIAKAYDTHDGEQLYNGLLALWRSSLSASPVVRIAEPLAFMPGQRLVIQSALDAELTLEDLMRCVLWTGAPEAIERLHGFVRAAAAGLAALHQSDACAGTRVAWDERAAEIARRHDRLAIVAPEAAAEIEALLAELNTYAAAHPPDPATPCHGAFDGAQVLIAQHPIGLIGFDRFCMAEPSLDVAHFRVSLVDIGMHILDEQTIYDDDARRACRRQLDQLGAIFLDQYRSLAPISPQRVALWEALDYLRAALQLWTKPERAGAELVVSNLEYHLQGMGI